ncbi:DUF7669 domain-containing protein [Tenggerimyces flavus]|uniref:DUF7669 domain-containing protein n=1 Tax=Tenggerimyces flavus TaxID=1708749 RepID=A0ABV7Y2H5_9ACTN|nr:hypothetical protein [Tenggerimyces flavus]MBM7790764.1 hypothetical protein [Tenggerimyces flavus]
MEPWESPRTWQRVADELRHHRRSGLGGLLTEDTVRFATARALVAEGADPAGLRVEWPHPSLDGARIDLVVSEPPIALIEFEYLREPPSLGPRLSRLAAVPLDAARLFVSVEAAGQLVESELAAQLVALRVDDELRLSVYCVDRLARRASARDGARREILAAVTRILARSGQQTFSPVEVVRELQDAGTSYAEATIRTMVTSHMCLNAPDHAAVTYDDFERLEHGVYRLAP